MTEKRAWEVKFLDTTAIVAAETRSKARARVIWCARDAGYRVSFLDPMRIRRAPGHDHRAAADTSGRCWSPQEATVL